MSDVKPERRLIVRFWRRSLRNYLRAATVEDTEITVDFLANQVLGDLEPSYSDYLFPAGTFDSFGIGKAKTRNNEHWAKDAVDDALSHLLMSLQTSEKIILRTMLLSFVVEDEKLADRNGKSIKEVVSRFKKKDHYIEIYWAISVNKFLKGEARVLAIINCPWPSFDETATINTPLRGRT